jgi:hypothetical protein
MMPELVWKTPIFHPNISSSGVVCLGGYGTYWVPSVTLDELCTMLWDMIRYKNFDPESPYNRQAALWAKQHSASRFPVDPRPIRNKVAQGSVGNPGATSTSARSVASTLNSFFPSRKAQSPFRSSRVDAGDFSGPPDSHYAREAERRVANLLHSGTSLTSGRDNSDPVARAAAMMNPVDAEIVIAEVVDHSPGMPRAPVVSRPPSGDILFIE